MHLLCGILLVSKNLQLAAHAYLADLVPWLPQVAFQTAVRSLANAVIQA